MKKIFKWLVVLPLIYLIGILSLVVFVTILIISDNTKWIWPNTILVNFSRFYRFLGTIENW